MNTNEEVIAQAILSQLGLSKEEAINALADKFGITLNPSHGAISSGDSVLTSQGESVAAVLTQVEANTLKEAAAISARIFS